MIGRSADELMRMESTDGTRVAVCAGGPSERQVAGRHRRADGSSFDAELVSAPIIEGGATVGTVVVLRDVEGLKRKPKARAVLLKYLERPSPETVLILVQSAGEAEALAEAFADQGVSFVGPPLGRVSGRAG